MFILVIMYNQYSLLTNIELSIYLFTNFISFSNKNKQKSDCRLIRQELQLYPWSLSWLCGLECITDTFKSSENILLTITGPDYYDVFPQLNIITAWEPSVLLSCCNVKFTETNILENKTVLEYDGSHTSP